MDDNRLKDPKRGDFDELTSLEIRKATRLLRDLTLPPRPTKDTDSLALLLSDRLE